MDYLLQTILLGVIEGITEFLPISSTGHLLIAEHWLGQRSELFNVSIQAGAILAVVLIYWQRIWNLFLGWATATHRDYVLKLTLSFLITVVGGFAAKQLGLELPETVAPVAWALIIGGIVIFIVERYVTHHQVSEQVTWKVAVVVGVGQIIAAVFPGTSRSAATIFAAMLAGLTSRAAATEFAFLVGIPTMFAATGYELLKVIKNDQVVTEDWSALVLGFVVSAVVAFIAVKWLLRYIQTHRFIVFAWYRFVLGAFLLIAL
jgi:undecaprenyl-diphosphatase